MVPKTALTMELVRVSLWLVFLERADLDLAEPDEPKIPLTIEPRSPPVFFLVVFFVPRKESTIEPNIFSHSGSSFLRLLLAVPEDVVLVVVVLVVVVLVGYQVEHGEVIGIITGSSRSNSIFFDIIDGIFKKSRTVTVTWTVCPRTVCWRI